MNTRRSKLVLSHQLHFPAEEEEETYSGNPDILLGDYTLLDIIEDCESVVLPVLAHVLITG
jgi:hypothetical protein